MRRFLAILLLLTSCHGAFACPMCKDSVPASDAQSAGGLPSGFNNSIYLMLGALFCVMCFLAFTIVKGVRASSTSNSRAFPVISKRG